MLYFANISGLTLEISIMLLFSSLIYLSRYTVGSFEYCLITFRFNFWSNLYFISGVLFNN